MQLYTFRRNVGLLALLVIPVVCLSMGGCPPQGGGDPVCGNGSVESGEECDDGNTTAGDGCSASCQDEDGGGTCGDGTVDTGEECDDGNTANDDGCSSTCQEEDDGPGRPLDEDGDGVLDEDDECPGTTRGAEVDATGCSDSDEDGVIDPDDDCPNTPANAEVDEQGCEPDADSDGIPDRADECDDVPAGDVDEDQDGCPDVDPAGDEDEDGVPNAEDDCPNTPSDEEADGQGCSPSQTPPVCGNGSVETGEQCDDGNTAGGDGCSATCQNEGGGGPVCGNGAVEAGEQCDDGNRVNGDGCSATCRDEVQAPGCGNGVVETGEDCDDGNTVSDDGCSATCDCELGGPCCGDGDVDSGEQCDDGNRTSGDCCNASCQIDSGAKENDCCASPLAIGEGSQVYSNVGATTDGPLEPDTQTVVGGCTFFNNSAIRSDLWYCYTATCGGPVVISLCGSGYDTKMAVYSGCECPSPEPTIDRPIACSDDDCGSGAENAQSRVAITAVAGQSYLVRVGGFFGNREQGEGRLTIRCGGDSCINGTGSCTIGHGDNEPGCETATCCNRVCEVDTFCCDVTWDAFCASQAEGFCSTTGFPACNAGAGGCDVDQTSPGCNDTECCNAVCETDPFCCIREWDENCVNQSDLVCEFCGRGRGACDETRTTPGCEDIACCARVCAVDEFCCNDQWDATCVDQAADLCGR